MKHPRLGHYRGTVNKLRKEYKITALDFDIMLYMSEHDMTSKYDIWKNVSSSKVSVQNSLNYLEGKNMIKNVRPHRVGRNGFPGGFAITGKGRGIITEFYMTMFPSWEL